MPLAVTLQTRTSYAVTGAPPLLAGARQRQGASAAAPSWPGFADRAAGAGRHGEAGRPDPRWAWRWPSRWAVAVAVAVPVVVGLGETDGFADRGGGRRRGHGRGHRRGSRDGVTVGVTVGVAVGDPAQPVTESPYLPTLP